MDDLLDLPRSVLLALWLAPDPAGTQPDRSALLRAVQGDDEPHDVVHDGGSQTSLSELLDEWTTGPLDVVLAPGDAGAAPAAVSAAAIDAGECLLLRTPTLCVAAVPQVQQFGSALEPGHLVAWKVTDVPDWRVATHGHNGSLQDADRDLRQGLLTVTEALVRLDVARWRPDDVDQVAALRDGALPRWRMPDHLDGRRARVLASAARLRAIVALATRDDGGAVSLWQADQRSAALRDVDRMSRRAIAAASTFPAI